MTLPRAFRTRQHHDMESCVFTLLSLHAHIIYILSLALDSLLNPSSSAFPFPIAHPQSLCSSLRSMAIVCIILVTNSLRLILVEGVYFTFAFA